MVRSEMQDRLDLLMACGYPIFVIGNTVVLPAEADEMFSEEEIEELEDHIRSSMMTEEG